MIPTNTFVAVDSPGAGGPNPTLDGVGLATWAHGGATKHTAAVYVPPIGEMLFVGTDCNFGSRCDPHSGNHGHAFTNNVEENKWTQVSGPCGIAGTESPVGMDEAPVLFRHADEMVYTAGNASGEMTNDGYEGPCVCDDPGAAQGSTRRRGALWRINPKQAKPSATVPPWKWELLIHAGRAVWDRDGNQNPQPWLENMIPWAGGTHSDVVTDSAITLLSGGFAHLPFPYSRDNPGNRFYDRPRDPDSPNTCTGPVSAGATGNHFALDTLGRWAYAMFCGAIIDPETCDTLFIDPPTNTKTLNAPRFFRHHLDLDIWQKLPDPKFRVYEPSARIPGGPFSHHGYSTELDLVWLARPRAVLFVDHGMTGPDGEVLGVHVFDTTLNTETDDPIRQFNKATGEWDVVPGPHPVWQSLPLVSTTPEIQIRANEKFYHPRQDVALIGGGPYIEKTYRFRYARP